MLCQIGWWASKINKCSLQNQLFSPVTVWQVSWGQYNTIITSGSLAKGFLCERKEWIHFFGLWWMMCLWLIFVFGLTTHDLNQLNKELQGRNKKLLGILIKICVFQNKLTLFCNANPSNASSKMPHLLSLPTYPTTHHSIQITEWWQEFLEMLKTIFVVFYFCLFVRVHITLKSDRQTYSYTIFFKLASKAAILASVFSAS